MDRSTLASRCPPAALAGCLALLPLARPAASQTVPLRLAPIASACQFDTASVRDTASFTLYLTPPRNATGGGDMSQSYAPFVHAVAAAFEPPAHVSMATWPGTFYREVVDGPTGEKELACSIGPLTGTARIEFTKGHVKAVTWDVVPDSPEVTQAIRSAVHRGTGQDQR